MAASAAPLPASVDRYLAIAPSVFSPPSPSSRRAAVSSISARPASRRAAQGTISLWVYPCFSESGPAGAEPEGGDHQAGVAEDRLGLDEPLALDAPHQGGGVHAYVGERDLGRIADADAVLVLGLAPGKARGAALHHEPARSAGGEGEDGIEVGEAAVADPLLVAVDPVAGDPAVLLDALGRGAQGAEIAAGLGLGGGIGHQEPFLGDAGEPELLLLRRAAEDDRIGAEERGEDAGRDPEVAAGEDLTDAIDVERAAAHAAVLLLEEEELDAELGAAHGADELDGELVAGVEVEESRFGEAVFREVADGLQRQIERFTIQSVCH